MAHFYNVKKMIVGLNSLRKRVGYTSYGAAVKSELGLKIAQNPPKGKVLVVTPHPDDDIFGCGGTLRLHLDQGDQVKILYLSNGKNERRRQEALAAGKILGTIEQEFWDTADGQIAIGDDSVAKLKKIIEDNKPSIIYAPSVIDTNSDHEEAALLLSKTLLKTKFNGQVLSYEVWQPLFSNRLITIDKVINIKRKAIRAHQSQLQDRNYFDAILGLNKYRAGMFGAGEYAEAFFASNRELYIKLNSR